MKKWLLKKLLKNFGVVNKYIHRSGQPNWLGLRVHYFLFPFRVVINLAWRPGEDPQDRPERNFCAKRDMQYITRNWGALGPPSWNEAYELIETLNDFVEHKSFCIWVHCEGGRDRTGGILALWKKNQGYSMENIIRDFERHGYPAWPWLKELLKE